jgi:tetratricopeptide (TPR) repeat protein
MFGLAGCGGSEGSPETVASGRETEHGHGQEAQVDSVPLQAYFDQGLRMLFGFNHPEAIRSFEQAARLDPDCAMCYWGLALTYGPNINAAMDSANGVRAYEAARKAAELADGASEKEQAYIRAIAVRYGPHPLADRARMDTVYSKGMFQVTAAYPDDPDAALYFAAALMNLSPWDYWTDDGIPREKTPLILATLEEALQRFPDHAGLCHYYIHAVEAAHPELAVPCAERLPDLMPGAGHLVHMPAHVYLRVGRYADAIDRNVHAVHADEAYISDRRPRTDYTLALYPHNYHFLCYAAGMAGRSEQAIGAALSAAENADQEAMREPGWGAIQHYLMTPLRTYVRFGKWDEILASEPPPADLPFPVATWHYARGMAFVRLGALDDAAAELGRLQELAGEPVMEEVTLWDLNSAAALLAIAVDVLEGELLAARGDHDLAVARLRDGVGREDALVYDEPPDWHLPVRHLLGAVLLEAGRAAEAEAVYLEDLAKYPENGWSLYGLAASLRAQGREPEAAEAEERFRAAWATADVELTTSRF